MEMEMVEFDSGFRTFSGPWPPVEIALVFSLTK